MKNEALAVLLVGLLAGCDPQQWLISVYTNATVPQHGDRLLIELLDDQGMLACKDCRRHFGAGDARLWPLSFGVTPEVRDPGAGLHVHAQLFRTDHLDGIDIRGGAFLDALAKLPEFVSSSAPTPVALRLDLSCFRVQPRLTPGSFQSCDPETGELTAEPVLSSPTADAPTPGSWAPGQEVPCQGTVPPDMTCVPGGSFIRGGVRYVNATVPEGGATQAAEPEMLVVLSPFALDIEEFQVRHYYALRQRFPTLPLPLLKDSDADWAGLCTATGTAADRNNQESLNCVSWQLADEICRRQGKRLPTETEWEYAAGNRGLETPYPWGSSEDVCGRAILGRSYTLAEGPSLAGGGVAYDCRFTAGGKLVAPGSVINGHADDRGLLLNLHNLAGNLAEWTADDELPYNEPCWGRIPLWRNWLQDPLCTVPKSSLAVLRGGDWSASIKHASVVYRRFATKSLFLDSLPDLLPRSYAIGFRCAKDMRPR